MAHDVFISYSHHDKAIAQDVCATLEAEGIRCWIALRDPSPGGEWATEIVQAIDSAKVVVLVYSGHCNDSRYVIRELDRAVHQAIPIIPFRVMDEKPAGALAFLLGGVHWLDAFTPPLIDHMPRLHKTVERFVPTQGLSGLVGGAAHGQIHGTPQEGVTSADQPNTSDEREDQIVQTEEEPTRNGTPGDTKSQNETPQKSQEFEPSSQFWSQNQGSVESRTRAMNIGYLLWGIACFSTILIPEFSAWNPNVVVFGVIIGVLASVLACAQISFAKGCDPRWVILGIIPVLGPLIVLLVAYRTLERRTTVGTDEDKSAGGPQERQQ